MSEGTKAIERSLPFDLEAEQAVLGSLLIDPEAIIALAPQLRPDDFYHEAHAHIYGAALALYERREPIDLVTLSSELERQGKLQQVGGTAYLADLVAAVPTAAHAEHYASAVRRSSLLRKLIQAGARIAALGYEEQLPVDEVLDRAEQILFEVARRRQHQDFVSLRTLLEQYFDKMDYLHQHRGQIVGVPTGFHDLDLLTGGLQKSDLIILAARPSAGKTALALSIAHHVASRGIPVAIFSLEMNREQLVQRLLALETGLDTQRLRLGYIDDDEWVELMKGFGRLAEAPIFIDDTPAISSMELRSKARRIKAEEDVQLIIVDYLQLMQSQRSDNRVQEISEISRSLKALARELDIPIIALSQLSRAVEARNPHIPVLADLRESGSIEQDADIVMFIYREEMYDPNTDKKGIAEVIVAKHRNGPTGTVPLRFFQRTTRFADLEVYRQYPEG
jgi:replicative DNA helicase